MCQTKNSVRVKNVLREFFLKRLSVYLSERGLGTRRGLDRQIQCEGVKVNGVLLFNPAHKVSASDTLVWQGKLVGGKPQKTRLWAYYKPKGVVVSHDDPQKRLTLYDKLRNTLPDNILKGLSAVGRLDYASEGLILLTNSGKLKRYLEHPQNRIKRTYRVRFRGRLPDNYAALSRQGLTVQGVVYAAFEMRVCEGGKKTYQNAELTLSEGKNREIRRIFKHWGCEVLRLERVRYGPFYLNNGERDAVVLQDLSLLKGFVFSD